MDLAVRDATVLAQDSGRRVLKGNDIACESGRFSGIGKRLAGRAEFEVDGRGKLLLPGLVNCHTHAAMTLFRGLADDRGFFDAWRGSVWPAEKKIKPRHVRAGSRLALLEMLRGGTTCFSDMYYYPEETARACEEIGMRAVLSRFFLDEPVNDASREVALGRLPKPTALVKYAVAPHAPYTVGREGFVAAAEFSRREGCLLKTHVSETREEVARIKKATGVRPVEWLESVGALSPRTIAAHCVWISGEEAGILGKSGATVAHCPVSNMKLAGGGALPLGKLLSAGANVALGTDGCASNNSLSMLETMKVCALLQKNYQRDAHVAPAGQVLDFATRNGARALGIPAGSIEEGRLADFFTLDLRHPNLSPRPASGFESLVVYSANHLNVRDVVVGGKPVVLDGEFVSAPAEKIVDDAVKAAGELFP